MAEPAKWESIRREFEQLLSEAKEVTTGKSYKDWRTRSEQVAAKAGLLLDSNTGEPVLLWLHKLDRYTESQIGHADWKPPYFHTRPAVQSLVTSLIERSLAYLRFSENQSRYLRRVGSQSNVAQEAPADTKVLSEAPVEPRPKGGRPPKISRELVDRAGDAKYDPKNHGKGNNEAAKILYQTLNPTPAQRRSVSTILKQRGYVSPDKREKLP